MAGLASCTDLGVKFNPPAGESALARLAYSIAPTGEQPPTL